MQKITFHKFNLGDVDDIEVYAAYPINEWLTKTDKGEWIAEHCNDLTWHSLPNDNYGWTISIRGSLTDQHATEYYLRFQE